MEKIEHRDEQGRLHAETGPAVIHPLGTREWYWHGIRHRADGPAIEHANGHYEYWAQGFCTLASWDPRRRDNLTPLQKLTWDIEPAELAQVHTFEEFQGLVRPLQIWTMSSEYRFPFDQHRPPYFAIGDHVEVGKVFNDKSILSRGVIIRVRIFLFDAN